MDWHVRPARASDAADLHRNCLPDRSSVEVADYLDWCMRQAAGGRMVRLVVEMNGQVVASGQLTVYRGRGEIASLVVAPAFRRRGMGGALLRALVAEARQRRLIEIELMAAAEASWVLAWYQSCGFEPVQRRVLPPDEPVVVLRRRLTVENKDGQDQSPGGG